jgi:hypothetical protein
MASDQRLTWDLVLQVLGTLERHGYHHRDNEHTGQAIGLIGDLARTYDGTLDAPRGYVVVPSEPQPPGSPAVLASAGEVKTLLTALDEAADYKRDRAAACTQCTDRSCTTCQRHLQIADTFDWLAVHMVRVDVATAVPQHAPDPSAPASDPARPATEWEAGQ